MGTTTTGDLTQCACGNEISGSIGRPVCTHCHVTRHNREPGTQQADAVDRPGVRPSGLRPFTGRPPAEYFARTYAVRLAEGFAMLGGAG